jgi:ribosomal protein S18 acetylase RimI-like enzyme
VSLRLRPMTEAEFRRWVTDVVPVYASELEESLRLTPEEAGGKAHDDVHSMLPRGLDTPDHWLWVVLDEDGERVGHLWMARETMGGAPRAYVYDIEIDPPHRGRGLGREAMLLAEREAVARGLERIDLNVWSVNVVARALYRSLGYEETRVQMTKQLPA